ncbi:F-box/kelch-repeat protein At1g57790-like [Bidens hawaiensis]|uniref:F-box/kelch-repeat protein At1g57790-like n=1 Tax=Bidens hawaiensis TaxID=980011 RepID=UPI0040494591
MERTLRNHFMCRLPLDHIDIKCKTDFKPIEGNGDIIMLDINNTKNEENNESHLLNIPFNVLEVIAKLCVGVEYLNFRATCKTCQLGAPIAQWSKGTALRKLQTPWLVVVNHNQGLITFTDPMFGDNYFINIPRELKGDMQILCSKYGWLLMMIHEIRKSRLVFFNPFTRDICELPGMYADMFCFSAPPTSSNCMVVGFDRCSEHVYVHFVAGEPHWRKLFVGANPHCLRFLTFHGSDLYAMCKDGELAIMREIKDVQLEYTWRRVTTKSATSLGKTLQYFLVKGDEHFLLVEMGELGEDIQVFKLNSCTQNWERIDGLGRHAIYICDTTCIYIEAKTQEMENKIYFPRLHSENQKMVFYSLETCMYHTSDGKSMEQNLSGTQHHIYTRTWIQPSWS